MWSRTAERHPLEIAEHKARQTGYSRRANEQAVSDWLNLTVHNILDDGTPFQVQTISNAVTPTTEFLVSIPEAELGKIVGKGGRHAKILRTLVWVFGKKHGVNYALNIQTRDRGELAVPVPGVCRFCGCSESRACVDENNRTCAWMDMSRTACSSAVCRAKFAAQQS